MEMTSYFAGQIASENGILWATEYGKRLRWSRGSVLAFGTQVRAFKPGRSRRIFRAKKSSARLPSEGK
jgi:hypothetical protein